MTYKTYVTSSKTYNVPVTLTNTVIIETSKIYSVTYTSIKTKPEIKTIPVTQVIPITYTKPVPVPITVTVPYTTTKSIVYTTTTCPGKCYPFTNLKPSTN